MFQLDDNFLQDLGLGNMPDDQKKAFLQHIYQELELRVGTKLAEGLSDGQLGEFEAIIEHDEQKTKDWLNENLTGYTSRPDFQQFMQDTGTQDANDPAFLSEYAATRWLEVNRPDYRDVVAAVLEELKAEITSNREHIVENNSGASSQPS
jgi:hypothetical protein